jgi:protein-disulfide isomerase
MSPRTLVVVQRLALLAAILASAALIIDYQNIGDPTFCGVESPCFKVRASDLGRDLAGLTAQVGLSVPHVGVIAHVLLLGASLAARTRRAVRVVAGVALVGALCAAGLLAAQLSIGELCAWCGVVDASSIVAAAASVLLARATVDEASAAWAREATASGVVLAWSAAAAAIVALPYLWARNPDAAPLHASIQALQVPGKVTVVSYTDFECPYCRNLAPHLDELKKDPRVAFVRKMAPLSFHPGAEPAALGYLCTDPSRQEAMAALLYAAKPNRLNERDVAALAVKAGEPSAEAALACMRSEETKAELAAQKATFEAAGGTGLPTTWVGDRVVKGYRPDAIARALEAEANGTGIGLPVWTMFLAAAVVGAVATALHRRAAAAHGAEEAAARRDAEHRAAKKAGGVSTRTEAKTSAESPRAKKRDSGTDEANVLTSRDSKADDPT